MAGVLTSNGSGIPASLNLSSGTSRRSSDLHFSLYCRPNPLADASAGGFRVRAAHDPHLPQKSERTGCGITT